MNDIEIIRNIEHYLSNSIINKKDDDFFKNGGWEVIDLEIAEAIQGLLNLYNKEKEKNNSISIQYEKVVNKLEDLEQIEKEHKEENGRLRDKTKELETENQNEFKRGFFTKVAENKTNTLKIESQVIPKSLVREKMNKDIKTNEHTILGGRRNGKTLEYGIRLGRIQICEELLEESDK